VKSHGGSISCESIVGEGSVFIVRLPLSGGSANNNLEIKNVS
jgi:signal transduction histidine kinase